MLKEEAKMTFEEMEQVAGGLQFYDEDTYRSAGIYLVDGGDSFFYKNHELTEKEAASLVYYMARVPEGKVEEAYKNKTWKQFLHGATAYARANLEDFQLSYDPKRAK